MTTVPAASGFAIPQDGIQMYGGSLSGPDARFADLTPEKGATLIGTSAEAVEAAAAPKVRPFVRAALADPGAVEQAVVRVAAVNSRTGHPVAPTVEQRVAVILEKARQMADAAAKAEAKLQRSRREHLDHVIGRQADDLPAWRLPPWGGERILTSRDGLRAVTVAWLAAADAEDVARAGRWLIDHGIIPEPEPEQPKRRGLRK